jgi:hypothetical protein
MSMPPIDGPEVHHHKPHHHIGDGKATPTGDHGAGQHADASVKAATKMSRQVWGQNDELSGGKHTGSPFVKASEKAHKASEKADHPLTAQSWHLNDGPVVNKGLDGRSLTDQKDPVKNLLGTGLFASRVPNIDGGNDRSVRSASTVPTTSEIPLRMTSLLPAADAPMKGFVQAAYRETSVPVVADQGPPFIMAPERPAFLVDAGQQLPVTDAVNTRDVVAPRDAVTTNDAAQKNVTAIDVRYSGTKTNDGQPPVPPDFIVKRDGTVQMVHNPDTTNQDRITVELERAPGKAGRELPPPQQQQAVDNLVNQLTQRYMQEQVSNDGQIHREGVVNDNQGLVSDRAKQATHALPTGEQELPPQVRHQVEHINRHGGRGRFTPREAAEDFAPRDVPRQRGETDKMAAIKDVASGFLNRNEKDPYHAVQHWSDQGHRVGRYGISGNQFRDWLGHLPQSEVEKMIQEGKLPAGALDLQKSILSGKDGSELTGGAKELSDFMSKMKSGQGDVSKAEIDKFLPKELQERIGTDMVKSYALSTADKDANGKPAQVNVGKVALSMVLGHAVTDEETNKPENRAIVDAAYKQYALAVQHEQNGTAAVQQGQNGTPGDGTINMSDSGRKIGAVARVDLGRALWSGSGAPGNLGCAASVSKVLHEAGVSNVSDNSVHGLSAKLQRQGWHAYKFEERQPGDVIIVDGGRHGHTGVVGETTNVTYDNHSSSGRWSADSPDFWYRRARGSQFYVLRPPSA